MVALQDAAACGLFTYSDHKAWSELVRVSQEKGWKSSIIYRIKKAGRKSLILTFCIGFMPLLLIIITMLTDLNSIMGLDTVNQTVCLLLLATPYYPDSIFYNYLCCICNGLCGLKETEMKVAEEINKAGGNDKDVALLSVGTFQQIRATAEAHGNYVNAEVEMNANPALQES